MENKYYMIATDALGILIFGALIYLALLLS